MTQPAELSFLGIAKEAVEGTFVPSTAYIGCKKIEVGRPIDYARVEAMRGSMVKEYGVVPTFKWGTVAIGGPVFADTIGWILASILGDLTNTGATGPFSSAMSLKNSGNGQPTTHSIDDNFVAGNQGVAGVKWTDLELKWTAEGLLEFDAKGIGLSVADQTKPSASMTGVLPTPAWIGVLTIGGTGVVKSSDGSIKFSRANKVMKLMNGTQIPTTVMLMALTVTGKYKAVIDDEVELNRYILNTQPTWVANFTQGAGASLTQLQVQCSQAAYDKDPKITQQAGEPVTIEAEFTAIANSTDAGASGGVSPCKVTVQSAVQGTAWQ